MNATVWFLVLIFRVDGRPHLFEHRQRFESQAACEKFMDTDPPPPAALKLKHGDFVYVCVPTDLLHHMREVERARQR